MKEVMPAWQLKLWRIGRDALVAMLVTLTLVTPSQASTTYRFPANACRGSGYYPAATGACKAGALATVECANKHVPTAVRTLTSATLAGMTCNAIYRGVEVATGIPFTNSFSFPVSTESPRPEVDLTEMALLRSGTQLCSALEESLQTAAPIVPATGEKVFDHQDYAGSGPDALSLVRSYRSGRVVGVITGPAGAGLGQTWSHNHRVYLRQEGNPGTVDSTVNVYFGDDTVRIFGWDTSSNAWLAVNSIDTLSTNSTGLLYKRQQDDSLWQFDTVGRLLTATRRNGWVTTYTYSTSSTPSTVAPVPGLLVGVSNQFGRSLNFAYNAASQLVSVSSSDGQIVNYAYDGTADTSRLMGVSYPGGASKTYWHENTSFPQLITGFSDELGVRISTVVYDSLGRATSSGHALGADQYGVSYATPGSAVVTDPLGTVRSYGYGSNANKLAVTSADKPSGISASTAASRVQGINGLVTEETDFLGVNTTYTWDVSRRLPLSTVNAVGLPESRATSTQWHAAFRLPILITEAEKTIAYTYDGMGNRLSQTITDTNTNVTRTTSWTYNAQGQVATVTVPGGVVASTYDYYTATSFSGTAPNEVGYTVGDLASVTNAAGHVTQYTHYDRAGRVRRMVDAKGVVTEVTYTPRGWVSAVVSTPPGGAARTTTYSYDAAGQLTGVVQPDGSTLSYEYDAAQRLVGVSDERGNTISYTLDAMGNRVGEEIKDSGDVLQRSISRSFDALNRLQQVTGAAQ